MSTDETERDIWEASAPTRETLTTLTHSSPDTPKENFTSNIASSFEFPTSLQSSYTTIPWPGHLVCDQVAALWDTLATATADSDFPFIFKAYVDVLCERKRNPVHDEYFQAVAHAAERDLATLEALSHRVTSLEASLFMREAAFRVQQETAVLTGAFRAWTDRLARVHQLSRMHEPHARQEAKRVLKRWFSRVVQARALAAQAVDLHTTYTTVNVWRNWLRIAALHAQSQREAEQFSPHRLLLRWRERFHTQVAHKATAVAHHHTRLQARVLQTLKEPLQTKPLRETGERLHLAVAFNLWLQRLAVIAERHLIAEQADPCTRRVMTRWVARTGVTLERTTKLGFQERRFVVGKCFRVWAAQHQLLAVEVEAKRVTNGVLASWMLIRWQKRTVERQMAERAQIAQRRRTLNQIFHNWHQRTVMTIAADAFYTSTLAEKCFRGWRLAVRAQTVPVRHGGALIELFFHRWRVLAASRQAESAANVARVHLHFERWVRRTRTVTHQVRSPMVHPLGAYFRVWVQAMQTLHDRALEADRLFRAKVFRALEQRVAVLSQHNDVAVHFREQADRQRAWQHWRQRYDEAFDSKHQSAVGAFQKQAAKRTTGIFIEQWLRGVQARQAKRAALQARLAEFVTSVVGLIWDTWVERTLFSKELNAMAVAVRHESLLHSALRQMSARTARVQEMTMQALEWEARADVRAMQNCFRAWSVKQHKVRNNIESSNSFRRRWEKAKLGMIVRLWRENAQTRASAEASVVDISPLASKRRSHGMVGHREPQTPRTNLSPSKLTETTERLKQERMSALRERYSRVRGSPGRSPPSLRERPLTALVSENSSLNAPPSPRFTLSPRDALHSDSFSAASPFDANADHYTKLPPLSVSLSPRGRLTRPPLLSKAAPRTDPRLSGPLREAEPLTVESAKRLNRITPIAIPPSGIVSPRIIPEVIRRRSDSFHGRSLQPETRTTISDRSFLPESTAGGV